MYLERDNDTDRPQKSVYIYIFVFTGTYIGPFCHDPVESRLIPLDSGSIPLESSGFLWNLAEWMHSCRNLWGIKKYSKNPIEPERVITSTMSTTTEQNTSNGKGEKCRAPKDFDGNEAKYKTWLRMTETYF